MFENPTSLFPMVRIVPYMGVIWTIHEASKLGFYLCLAPYIVQSPDRRGL